MSELTPKSDRLGRLIGHVSEMYNKLNDAMNTLRRAGVGDTRYALQEAHEIETLLRRIDGKEIIHERTSEQR